MNNPIYINAAQALSPQHTFLIKVLPVEVESFHAIMKFKAPDYKAYFNPAQRRRMSSLVKASSVCAAGCVTEAGIEKPNAIIVATSLGSIEESEKFLNKMIDECAEYLTPTNFIQANHNSPGAQIALNYGCNGYNVVYSHKSASFESALIDAMMLIDDQEAQNVLVGGIDEITDENYELKKTIGLWKDEPFSSNDILLSNSPGSVPGEGIAFFMLSAVRSANCYAELKGVTLVPYAQEAGDVLASIKDFLEEQSINPESVDLVMTGNNGDIAGDAFADRIVDAAFPDAIKARYKHLCGEYDTASAFGMWLAAWTLKQGKLPEYVGLNPEGVIIKRILLYHHDGCLNHSFMLLDSIIPYN